MSLRRFRPATIFASLVLAAALLLPGRSMPVVSLPGLDKLVHVLLFGFWALALRFDWTLFRRRPALLVLVVALAAPLTEAAQLLSPGRSFDYRDMAADLAGAALAALAGGPAVALAERAVAAFRRAAGAGRKK